MKSTFFQEYLVKLGFISLFIGCILSPFGSALWAIIISSIFPLINCRFIFHKLWDNEGEILGEKHYQIIPTWKKWLYSIIVVVLTSQSGWLALLV